MSSCNIFKIRKPYLFFVFVAVNVLLLSAAASAFGEGLPGLFVPADGQNAALLSDSPIPDPIEVREQMVLINRAAVDGPGALDASESIMLNLFDDVSLIAVRDRAERRSASRLSWFGRIPGDPLSSVILVVQDGSITGNIVHSGRMFQVRPLSSGIHRVVEIDPSAFPPESEPRIPPQTPADRDFQYVMQADDGSFIDVMVVYTADAVASAGSVAALESQIQLAIDETNQSYLNSGITQRVQLAHTEQVAYTQSGAIGTDLNRLTYIDGFIDNVHPLRDTHKADLVSLWVYYPGSSCGIAWLMTSVSSGFAPYGFSVVNRTCATGYYSFGHEMGHNMGARHDWYVDSGTMPFAYSHGFLNTTDRWRSIMAYNDQCAAGGFNCTRIQYWSNPDLLYNFDPLGIAEGMPNAADNRKTLNNTAFTVANFRLGCSYSINPTSDSFDPNGGADSVAVTADQGCGWTAVSNNPSWLTVTGGSPGSGSGTVNYSVSSYTGFGSRSGTMTVAGRTFTVTQAGCTYSLSPGSQTFGYNGGPNSFTVTTQAICPWTATEGLDWVTASGSGTGSGTVSYSVDACTEVPSRTGNINVANKTFIVTQTGVPPAANFSGTPLAGNVVPFQVIFTDLSDNSPTGWDWNFGDGETSNLQNPAHTFKGTGPYNISLTVISANGSDTMSKNAYISAAVCGNAPLRRAGNPYTSIQTAYDEIADDGTDTIDIQAVDFEGALTFGKNKTVTLMGGYTCDYLSRIPGTVVIDSVTISDAKIIFDSISIR